MENLCPLAHTWVQLIHWQWTLIFSLVNLLVINIVFESNHCLWIDKINSLDVINYFLKRLLVMNKLNHLQLIEENVNQKKHSSNSISKAQWYISWQPYTYSPSAIRLCLGRSWVWRLLNRNFFESLFVVF